MVTRNEYPSQATEASYFQGSNGPSGHYMVRFKTGHDLKKHFAFLGRDFHCQTFHISTAAFGYHADMDADLIRSVRSDPGVSLVEDDFGETMNEDWIRDLDLKPPHVCPETGYEAPYRHDSRGPTGRYLVFFGPFYTVQEHFKTTQRGFALSEWQIVNGYSARLDDELLALVRSDSGVKVVEDDSVNAAAEPQLPWYIHYVPASQGEYLVGLRSGYPVQKHFNNLNIRYDSRELTEDLYGIQRYTLPESEVKVTEFEDTSGRGASYSMKGAGDDLFRAVMRDPGVLYVANVPSVEIATDDADEDDFIGIFD